MVGIGEDLSSPLFLSTAIKSRFCHPALVSQLIHTVITLNSSDMHTQRANAETVLSFYPQLCTSDKNHEHLVCYIVVLCIVDVMSVCA
jgi:hypothetical protein